jgi:hypothetical protein
MWTLFFFIFFLFFFVASVLCEPHESLLFGVDSAEDVLHTVVSFCVFATT